jgi:hypothetical protein
LRIQFNKLTSLRQDYGIRLKYYWIKNFITLER